MINRRFLEVFLIVLIMCLYHSLAFSKTLKLTPEPIQKEMPRYGLNLGGSGQWGAEQLRSNILNNPGFEPVLDRTIFVVGKTSFHHLTDDNNWLAREDGFWNLSTYHVLTGAFQGENGRILDSLKNRNNEAEIAISKNAMTFSKGDVIALTRQKDIHTPYGWRVLQGRVLNERNDLPRNTTGQQAIHLTSTSVMSTEIVQYFDNISDRAGQLLPVNGTWRFTFKAKGLSPDSEVSIHFNRSGQQVFLSDSVKLSPDWQEYTLSFQGSNDKSPGVLTFSIRSQNGDMLLDDAYLGTQEKGFAGFRSEVVETLKQLKPGFLRDWQGQLGDTFANRIADEFGHQPVRYRSGVNDVQHHYNLPDFLALCAEINASPWVIAPTTFDANEWKLFGQYLKAAADKYHFQQIMVEFGNENWNPMFRPGGITDNRQHAITADFAFQQLALGSNADPRISTVVNAQFANPDSPKSMAESSHNANYVAVAPYFLYRLTKEMNADQAIAKALSESGTLFQQEVDDAKKNQKHLAVYEVNLHTTLGDADATLVNQVVTSGVSGVALARRLMQASIHGVREQAVYSLSGFDTYQENSKNLIHLWGITRDLTKAGNYRPTGLALFMLNTIANGEVNPLFCEKETCSELTGIAFDRTRAAIVSASSQPEQLTVELNCKNTPYLSHQLKGDDLSKNNEHGVNVQIQTIPTQCNDQGQLELTVPPFSLVTLQPVTST